MPRAKLARTEVLEHARQMKQVLVRVVRNWSVEKTVWRSLPSVTAVSELDGRTYTYAWSETRPRLFEEFPENRAESWDELISDCELVMEMATQMIIYAQTKKRGMRL